MSAIRKRTPDPLFKARLFWWVSAVVISFSSSVTAEDSPPTPETNIQEKMGEQLDGSVQVSPERGPSYVLEKIEVRGNKKTIEQVILRNIEISIGEVFFADDVRIQRAKYRLLASGLFYRVELFLERGSRRGAAKLVVRVKERNTIVVQDIVFGLSEMNPSGTMSQLIPYGSLDIADRSFFGSGVNISAAGVWSYKQYGYRLRFLDSHFAGSDFGLRAEGWFAHTRDFFGNKGVCKTTCPCDDKDSDCPDSSKDARYGDYADMEYNRTGFKLGTSYIMPKDSHLFLDYRLEMIDAAVPPAGSHISFGERTPIVYGNLLPGYSFLSSLFLGIIRDTRDSLLIASDGSRTAFEVELSTQVIGSSYDYSKFTLAHDVFFPLGKGHSIRLGLFLGLIMGNAPFFNKFFVGDFSAFVPSRVLEMNFSPLQPNLLKTSIVEMRYEDMATSLDVEYSVPFYRGQGFFYAVNGFVGVGIFALTSQKYLKMDPPTYQGYKAIPMDLTFDLGVKVDTEIGLFVFSMANLFRMIPSIGRALTE